ncbi:hypothetical protein Hanom_Chr11g01044411 [Helianthus anomalus]
MVHYVLYLWMNILFFAGKLHWVLYLGMKEVEKAKNQKVLLLFFCQQASLRFNQYFILFHVLMLQNTDPSFYALRLLTFSDVFGIFCMLCRICEIVLLTVALYVLNSKHIFLLFLSFYCVGLHYYLDYVNTL